MTYVEKDPTACESKQQFTFSQAKRQVKRSKVRGLESYKCSVCKQWHIGKNPRYMGKGLRK